MVALAGRGPRQPAELDATSAGQRVKPTGRHSRAHARIADFRGAREAARRLAPASNVTRSRLISVSLSFTSGPLSSGWLACRPRELASRLLGQQL